MLPRTILILFALASAPAFALDGDHASAGMTSHRSPPAAEASASALTPATDDSPAASYGLALATLALVGFMSRR